MHLLMAMPSLSALFVALALLAAPALPQQTSGTSAMARQQLCARVFNRDAARTQGLVHQCVQETGVQPSLFTSIRRIVERSERAGVTREQALAARQRVEQMLAAAGHPLALQQFTRCIHAKKGHLSDGVIDMQRLRASLLGLVVGTSVEETVRGALVTCPSVQGTEVTPFLSCVARACINGRQ